MSLDAPKRLRGDGAGKPELSVVCNGCKLKALNVKPQKQQKSAHNAKKQPTLVGRGSRKS